MGHLFCFGLGYTAKRLITCLSNSDLSDKAKWKFSGTSRSELYFPSAQIYLFDSLLILPEDITHILISIPPKETGDIVYTRFLGQIAKLPNLKWVGFLSSTGVYGNHNGDWVTEESVINLGSSLARFRLIAENQWLDAHITSGVPSHIMRLSGIYGPGRSALENAISGRLKIIEEDVIFSRMHIDDIIKVLSLSMINPNPSSIYNLADDYPCNPRVVAEFACSLLNINPPKPIALEAAELSQVGIGFYTQSKRVSNNKIKTEFKLELTYPSYKEGILAIAKECGYILG